MTVWITIFAMAVVTFSNRYVFFAAGVRYTLGSRMQRLLSYSAYAIMTAIWAPIIVAFEPGSGFHSAGYDYALAACLAAVMAILRIRTIIVVLVSSALFFILRFAF